MLLDLYVQGYGYMCCYKNDYPRKILLTIPTAEVKIDKSIRGISTPVYLQD